MTVARPQASASDESVWNIVTEPRVLEGVKNPDGSPMHYMEEFVRRADGFTLEEMGVVSPEERTQRFRLTAAFGTFEFMANRWDNLAAKPAARYSVYAFLLDDMERAFCLRYAKDIASALLHFPPSRTFDFLPVSEVVFSLQDGEGFKDISAEEAQRHV